MTKEKNKRWQDDPVFSAGVEAGIEVARDEIEKLKLENNELKKKLEEK